MFVMMGGISALGTHAASILATIPSKIKLLKDRLIQEIKIDINDHNKGFYAVVSLRAKIIPNKGRFRDQEKGKKGLRNAQG